MQVSNARWASLLALVTAPLGCAGDDASTDTSATTGSYSSEPRCRAREEAWASASMSAATTSAVASTAEAATASAASSGGGTGGDATGGGGVGGAEAGSGGFGAAASGGASTGTSLPPGCPGVDGLNKVSSDDPNECCYESPPENAGRPLFVENERVITRSAFKTGPTWTNAVELTDLTALDPADVGALATHWRQEALAEHASIASFAQLTLELLLLGAPAELVRGAQEAGLEEVQHAEACFGVLASLHCPLGPAAMPELANLKPRDSAAAILSATIRDACIAETHAAFVLGARAARCTIPALRATLERLADDETRHAAFGFRIVRWALEARLVDEAFVRETFMGHLAAFAAAARSASGDDPAPRAGLGLVGPEEVRALADDLAPKLVELLGAIAPAPAN